MRFAYADPPYPGMSARYYRDHADFAGEVDHKRLVEQLSPPGRYDGWALSTSAAALPMVLGLCAGLPVRVAAWVKGSRPNAHPHGPLSSWEPVVYCGGRDGAARDDSLSHAARPRTTDPGRVVGAKPAVFARWLFELLGAQPGDELDDLFPGSGGIARAWSLYASGMATSDASCEYSDDASLVDDGYASSRTWTDTSPGHNETRRVERPRYATDPSQQARANGCHPSQEYSRDTSSSSPHDASQKALCDA